MRRIFRGQKFQGRYYYPVTYVQETKCLCDEMSATKYPCDEMSVYPKLPFGNVRQCTLTAPDYKIDISRKITKSVNVMIVVSNLRYRNIQSIKISAFDQLKWLS